MKILAKFSITAMIENFTNFVDDFVEIAYFQAKFLITLESAPSDLDQIKHILQFQL